MTEVTRMRWLVFQISVRLRQLLSVSVSRSADVFQSFQIHSIINPKAAVL